MKTAYINGECFEVIHSTAKANAYIDRHVHDYMGRTRLEDFYENPSSIKVSIWNSWLDWAADSWPVVERMHVISASRFCFTIGALYVDISTDEIIGYIHITKDHNRLYLL